MLHNTQEPVYQKMLCRSEPRPKKHPAAKGAELPRWYPLPTPVKVVTVRIDDAKSRSKLEIVYHMATV